MDAHLSDGGMSRRVARELLDTAAAGIGGLLPRGDAGAMPPPLLDTDSRLQASFSRVLGAVCEGGEARVRAERAVAVAEAAQAREPSEARALAVMKAENVLAHAMEAEGDWTGAQALLERSAQRAAGHDGEDWMAAAQDARRDLAYTLIDGPDQARAVTLLRDDLAWQRTRTATKPDDPKVLSQVAADHRFLAYAARVSRDLPGALAALDSEAAVLLRVAAQDPANMAWQRYLGTNAQAVSQILTQQGNHPAAVARAREAAERGAALLAHDPENGLWRIGSLIADTRLADALAKSGDIGAARGVLRDSIGRVKALFAPGTANRLCQTEAAQMLSIIGNSMAIFGSGADGVAALEDGVLLARSMAQAAPGDLGLRHAVVVAETNLVRVASVSKLPEAAIAHARAGIAALQELMAQKPGNAAWQDELTWLRLELGDALRLTGDADGALVAYGEDIASNQAFLDANPGDGKWRAAIATDLVRASFAYLHAGRRAENWAALQAAAAAIAPLEGQANLPQPVQLVRIEVWQQLGGAELDRHDVDAGLAHQRQALALADALAAVAPNDFKAANCQLTALISMAVGLHAAGRDAEAEPYMGRAAAARARVMAMMMH